MTRFTEAVTTASQALRDAGYPSAQLAILVSRADVDAIQRELEVASAIIEEALHPTEPVAFGMRLLAVVDGVRIYVEN